MFSGFKSAKLAFLSSVDGELTSMDNTLVMQILDCARHCPDDILGIPVRQS